MPKQQTLTTLFNPASIAIIGASRHRDKVGFIVLHNIVNGGYKGKIFPVNPGESWLMGHRAYASVAALPSVPDLAILAVPAAVVMELLPVIAEKGIKNILIFSAGFKEMGGEGAVREETLAELAKKYGLRILGPNCLGFVNTSLKLNDTFGKTDLRPGNVRVVSQSGAIVSSLFDWAAESRLGFKECVTLGNKTVLTENDILEYWSTKRATPRHEQGLSNYEPVGLYLESIPQGRAFFESVYALSKHQPVFVLKPGKSVSAQKAMHSHTGSLAGEDKVAMAAFEQAGAIRCGGLEDFFDLTKAFAWENAPAGPRVAVVSNAGGPAVVAVDALEAEGLTLATIDEKTSQVLSANLPHAASIVNPVDLLGDALPARYAVALEAVLLEKMVDAVLVMLTPQIMTEIEKTAALIGSLSRKYKKPIVCSFVGGTSIERGEQVLNRYRIPSFRFPERAAYVLGRMWWWQNWRTEQMHVKLLPFSAARKPVHIDSLLHSIHDSERRTLSSLEAHYVLREWGVLTPPEKEVESESQARAFAAQVGWPVVLKLSSPELLHKSGVRAVYPGLSDVGSVKRAYGALKKLLPRYALSSLMAQKHITGLELVVGIKRDPHFGPTLLLGMGGVLVDLFKEHQLLLLPLRNDQIVAALERSAFYPLLVGYRGEKSFAQSELVALIQKLSSLVATFACIGEVEINPVILTHEKAFAVDGKIVLNKV